MCCYAWPQPIYDIMAIDIFILRMRIVLDSSVLIDYHQNGKKKFIHFVAISA